MLPQFREENNVAAVVRLHFTFRREMVTAGTGRTRIREVHCFAVLRMAKPKQLTKTAAIVVLLAVSAYVAAQSSPASRADFTRHLVAAAVERSTVHVRYVADYVRIPYPGGDVPADTGVCTDEIIRIYRKVRIDLQKEVHEDIVANFREYPRKWRWVSPQPDTNIDHRRVPNLMVFFRRKGESLPITTGAADYLPGDIVAWDLGGGQTHIGMVVDRQPLLARRHMILHNIGRGPQIEDVLFNWKIIGHYRYFGPTMAPSSTVSANAHSHH